MIDIIASWFDTLTLGTTLVTVLLQCYAVALEVKISPKEMCTFRYFLCICTVQN
jgi:hypothetical protein